MASDAARRLNAVIALAGAFRQQADKPMQQAYLMGLADIPSERIEEIIVEAIKTEEYMPTVSRLRKMAGCDFSPGTRAVIAFEILTKSVSSVGAYRSVVFDDHVLNTTIASLGGWVTVCETSEKEWHDFFRKRFCEVYKANCEAKRGTKAVQLGLCDRENWAKGFPVSEPVRIATGLPPIAGLIAKEKPPPVALPALKNIGKLA